MPDYYDYMMRHGEPWIQDLVERLERNARIKSDFLIPLEQRWANAMYRPDLDAQSLQFAAA
jgi:hypothetical protein